MVSTTVATDISLNGISIDAEYLFLKTVPHLDRDGLILADAPILWGRVCPRRPQLLAKVDELVSEWITAELAIAYQTPDGRALFFPGFAKNQTFQYNREGKSTIPAPPGYIRTDAGLTLAPSEDYQQTDGHTLDELQSNSRVDTEELTVKGREVKLREGEGKGATSAAFVAWGQTHPIDSITPKDNESLGVMVDLYGDDSVARAIGYCHSHKTTKFVNFTYLEKTLMGWQQDGKLYGPTNGNGNKPPPVVPKRIQLPDGQIVEVGA